MQQTFLQAHRALKDFRGNTDAELAAWLRQILARNMAHLARDQRRAGRIGKYNNLSADWSEWVG